MKNRSKRVNCRARRAGFTLIELLTVIAIIAILASISMVAVPRYLDKARESQTEANMSSVVQAVSEYAARSENTGGYPTAYGFIKQEFSGQDDTTFVDDTFKEERPYTMLIGLQEDTSLHQVSRYTDSYDMNGDGVLSLFEFLPIGQKVPGSNSYVFSNLIYDGSNSPMSGGVDEKIAQLNDADTRPFVYIPFNSRQLATATKYWYTIGEVDEPPAGASFDADTDATLQGRMFFPPSQYDGFVLIGAGPGGTDGGLTSIAIPGTPGTDYEDSVVYHVLALRIAFLATRDSDDDKALDFDYRARKNASTVHILPDGTNGYGAFIKVVQ